MTRQTRNCIFSVQLKSRSLIKAAALSQRVRMSVLTEKFPINRKKPLNEIVFAYIKEFSIPAIFLAVLVGLMIFIVGKYYPKVGHDYGFFIPRMLDTHLHHRVNGLGIH